MIKEDLLTCIPSLTDEEAEKLVELFNAQMAEKSEEYELQLEEISKEQKRTEFERILISELEAARPKSIDVLRTLLDESAISLEDGAICGLSEQLERLRSEYEFLFCRENERPRFTKEMRQEAEEADLSKMSYKERLHLYEKMPELYKRLVK